MSYLQRRAKSTTNTHRTQNHVSYGITYLVRYSSSYLLVLLCTTNKTGGGRATAGEWCMYTANTAAALPAVIYLVHVFRTTWCIAILVLLCTTNTSVGARAKVGERRRASDMLYGHSNTAVPAVVSTFFRYLDRIYISSLLIAPVRNFFFFFTTRANFSAAASERRRTTYE